MATSAAVRVDRWLWSIRAYKSRSAATKACTNGQVSIGDEHVKPARRVLVGDVVVCRRSGSERIYKVVRLIDKRVGAPIAVECYEDLSPPPTPRSDDDIFGVSGVSGVREPGTGRPTKRERRQIDRFRQR